MNCNFDPIPIRTIKTKDCIETKSKKRVDPKLKKELKFCSCDRVVLKEYEMSYQLKQNNLNKTKKTLYLTHGDGNKTCFL